MPFARASELDRLLACPGSLVLPKEEVKSERAKEAAEYGELVHYWKETGEIGKGRGGTTLKKKLIEGVDRDALWIEGLHEVPLAYNVLTGESRAMVLPLSKDKRDLWKATFGDEWLTGTADYVGLLLEKPWVDDLKTGRQVDYIDHRYQQAFYALVWTLFQMGELTQCRSTITHWPKYPIKNKPRRFGTVLEPDFFLDFQVKLKQLREDVMRMKDKQERGLEIWGHLSDGPQCKYCPSKLACIKGMKYE